MLQKTNKKITAPSLKSVWCIVSKLFAETRHSKIQGFIWRPHVGVPRMASNQQNIWTSVCDKIRLFLLANWTKWA